MRNLYDIQGYTSSLSQRDTQRAIKKTKDLFQLELSSSLNLDRVTAPLLVTKDSGLNDDLNGVERKVSFEMKEIEGTAEIVQSLAKWKRMALHRYGYKVGEGIYTDMNAIRRDDDCDNIHSIYVDQWDWERVICSADRTYEFLKTIVREIAKCVSSVKDELNKTYPCLRYKLDPDVFFITTEELEEMYPTLTPKERENAIIKEHSTVFLARIGWALKNGKPHDGRAPDYDDWLLNGDLLYRNETLGGTAFEISSMGIRVNEESLLKQLKERNAEERLVFPYHQMIMNQELPLTIGGGIGQSRLCMLILEKAHIGEVQCSIWPKQMREDCEKKGIILL